MPKMGSKKAAFHASDDLYGIGFPERIVQLICEAIEKGEPPDEVDLQLLVWLYRNGWIKFANHKKRNTRKQLEIAEAVVQRRQMYANFEDTRSSAITAVARHYCKSFKVVEQYYDKWREGAELEVAIRTGDRETLQKKWPELYSALYRQKKTKKKNIPWLRS